MNKPVTFWQVMLYIALYDIVDGIVNRFLL